MPRVLFAADALLPPAGGAERAALEVLAHLAARGDVVDAIGSAPRRPDGEAEPPPGLTWEPLPRGPGNTWTDRRARAAALAGAVDGVLARRRADVVITQQLAAPSVIDTAGAAGIPTILCLHGWESLCHWRFLPGSGCIPASRCRDCPKTRALPEHERADRLWFADAHRVALRRASALVAPSMTVARELTAACGRTPAVIAPIGTFPRPVAADRDGPVLAVSSVWTAAKGADLLAPIARAIAPRRLVVQVGDGGRTVALPRLPANADVRRERSEIGPLLSGCSLVVVPSQLPEPFARVAVEAMAAGVPVLVSDVGGLRESVPVAQRVSPHDDPRAWATALARALEPQAWERALAAGRAAASGVATTRPLDRFAALVDSVSAEAREAATAASSARPTP